MKCQSLFSEKNKKKNFKKGSTQILTQHGGKQSIKTSWEYKIYEEVMDTYL